MRLIFTLLLLFSAAAKIPAQKISDEAKVALSHFNQKPLRFKTGCSTWKEIDFGRSLLVIDGVPDESAVPQNLNADDIASIDVLKKEALGTFGCRHWRDIILVTTKSASERKFMVRDFLTGEKIPAATIQFVSGTDTIKAVSDENGKLTTGKLISGKQYSVTVSSIGYKTLVVPTAGKEQEILLEPDIKTCGEVVVIGYPGIRCGRVYSNVITKRTNCGIKTDSVLTAKTQRSFDQPAIISLYPNPVQRNNSFCIELKHDGDEAIQLNIYSLNGSLVLQQSEKIIGGYNRLSISANAKWAAGLYIVQLKDQAGKTINQSKLVVQ